jgi:hypothetical protein
MRHVIKEKFVSLPSNFIDIPAIENQGFNAIPKAILLF